ncbi:MAG: NAD(P)-dependent oxidoreductase [bacterium]|nr:NAD(P)-dependent oxidoreductase [bacterium]
MAYSTIVFGSSGFFGPILLERYPELISIGRTPPPAYLKNKHIAMLSIDDLKILDNVDFDAIVFLIGNSNHHELNGKCMSAFEYNVIPLKKILYYLTSTKKKLKKFIAFTGALLYDAKRLTIPVTETHPLNPYINEYVFSKYIAEEVTKLYPTIPTINVRLSNIYGPTRLIRPDIIPTVIQGALSPHETTVWSVKPKRDFVYGKDVADAVIKLIDTDYVGSINVGSGIMRPVADVVAIIERLSGKKIKVLDVPVTGPMQFQHDIALLERLTGWKPQYSLETGLAETYKIMKSYADECRWWERIPTSQ